MKYVKNNTLSTDTWLGKKLAAGEVYEIPITSHERWQKAAHDTSEKVHIDVNSGDLQVSKDGSTWMTASDGIAWLQAGDANIVKNAIIMSAPTDGQIMQYEASTDKWKCVSINVNFGAEFQTAESLLESVTSSTLFQQKLRLTTTNLPSADYILLWSAMVGSPSDDKEAVFRLQHNDTTDLHIQDMKTKGNDLGGGPLFPFSGHAKLTLSGVNTFDIDYKKGSGDAKISNARLTLWRVS